MKIHLLHTNDVHSQIENYMRLGHRLKALRRGLASRGEPVLTFDIGDVLDRVRPETEATLGGLNADLMSSIGYDGYVFGNNEGLTIPVGCWEAFAQRTDTVVYGTNLRRSDGERFPYFQDNHVYDCGGVKVGVFGVTPNYEKPYERLGVQVLHPVEQAKTTVRHLYEIGCHVIVALSHLGHHDDRVLASCVEGIHVILGGHTHQFMQQAEWVGNTAIFQAGKHALAFGHTELEYNRETGVLTNVDCSLQPLHHDEPYDTDMWRVYQNEQPVVDDILSTPVIRISEPLEVSYESESPFANALVDALFETYDADIGIMMTGALNASLLPGCIERKHILGACSTPTRPILMSLKGSNLLSIIQKAIQPQSFLKPGFGYGFRGSVIGYMALAGATAVISGEDATGFRLLEVRIHDEPVVPDKLYRVVTCEFLWLSPSFTEFQDGVDVEFEPPLVREVLIEQLDRPGRLEKSRAPRYIKLT